jgi:hypothetical protein
VVRALEYIRDAISTVYPIAELGETKFAFDSACGQTTIQATPVGVTTVDGFLILDRIDIRTRHLARKELPTDAQIAVLNTRATTGALIRDSDLNDVVVVSSVALFEGDEDSLHNLYAPMVVWGALHHSYHGVSHGYPYKEYTRASDRSYWDAGEFQATTSGLADAGFYSSAGPTGLSVEFPWEAGGTSALLGDVTSLLTFQSNLVYPRMGQGLFFKLELPVQISSARLIRLANHLNRLEASGIDVPPFFGAWCYTAATSHLAHVGFWPNALYRPGITLNIAAWMKIRAEIARTVMANTS